ncbi:hypothetical protein EG329_010747 [Mollisiaceae sp. DMI_Dod_QoI]|nr:hypothetical protein EG329_010747 [Helotiales sp. DMI_Dod_QoI]
MLDGILSVCRICGNQPSLQKDISDCSPALSDSKLMTGSVDPFSVLPAKSSPRVHALTYHWSNTLALFPTKINSQYCTNPIWLSQAVNNETFFNATLYVSSVHDAGLRGKRGTSESLYYKAQTIRLLNKSLRNPKEAISDETLAAVLLLTHVVSLIGEPNEAEIHMKGLQQMMALRGGIQHYTLDGVFLHMLCIVNHLTAVLSESPTITSPSGIPYKPKPNCNSTTTSSLTSTSSTRSPAETSPLLKPYAIAICFHPTVVDLLHDMQYLYFVIDAFTTKFIPEFRQGFEDVVRSIELISKIEDEREKEWVVKRLKRWGDGEVLVRRSHGEDVKA